jgi:hypothetical protein
MDNEENLITTKIKEISEEYWHDHCSPVLLSALPLILERAGRNYRAALGSRTLKGFIKETADEAGYKLVEHPSQQARVGVVPADADYHFPPEPNHITKAIPAKSNKEATLAFFHALATLPERAVVLPL